MGLSLTLLTIPFYFKGNMGSQLDFHPSWNEAERTQIQQCYNRFITTADLITPEASREFVQYYFDSKWGNTVLLGIYDILYPFSHQVEQEYLTGDTRKMIKSTAETGNASLTDENNSSLLIFSLAMGEYELAQSLVKRGADVNLHSRVPFIIDMPGDTPLSWAVSTRICDQAT